MIRNTGMKRRFKSIYSNDNDAMIPEFWANETLAILEENMFIAGMVHRDFENQLANYGDIVNTRKPAEMTAYFKVDGDSVTVNDATLTNIQIPMNRWIHTSFNIYDGERSKAMKDLVQTHLVPASLALRRQVDRIILGTYAQFLARAQFVGKLNGLSSSTAKDYILDLRKKQNILKNSPDGRNLIWGPSSETEVLKAELFHAADKVGDNGTALREASLGRKLGYDHWMGQNMAEVYFGTNTKTTGAINNAAGYPVGTTSITVDGFAAAIGVGSWVSVDGQPFRVVSTTGGATPTAIVLNNGLVNAVSDNAVVYAYTPGQVNNASGYAAGWAKPITVDTFTVAPQVGQAVSFGITAPGTTPSTNTEVYTIIAASLTSITLDRPLESAIVDDAKVNIAPEGYYNLSFMKEAIAFVCRPLAPAPAGTGALSAVANSQNLSMRSTISYNSTTQSLLITLDMLLGIKVIEPLKGSILLG